jgi:hypothetical protein
MDPNSKVVTVDILVSPQLATQTDVSNMTGWYEWLQKNQKSFSVQVQGVANSFPLTLDLSKLTAGAWDEIFANATVGTAYQDGAQPPKLAISGAAVSMRSSHEAVHAFYSEVMLTREVSTTSLGPDHAFLQTLHDAAASRHGLQGTANGGNTTVSSLGLPTPTEQSNFELVMGRLGIALDSTTGVARAAQGVAPRLTPAHLAQSSLPSAALAGIAHLLDRMQNAPAPSLDLTLNHVPPTIYVSEPVPYSLSFSLSNGTAPFNWSFKRLPDGLSGNTASGAIQGIAQTPGNYQAAITVTDSSVVQRSRSFRLSIPVLPARLPDGCVNRHYNAQIYAPNGPYTWSIAAGALPTGLALDANSGKISGIPTDWPESPAVPATITFQGAVGGVVRTTRTLTITITTAPEGMPLPCAVVGKDYSVPTIAGPTNNCFWTIASGRLPDGLTLDPGTGIISGKPTHVGKGTFRVVMKDSEPIPTVKEQDYILPVARSHGVFVDSLPPGLVNQSYSSALAKTTPAAYTYQITGGTLPSGLSFDPHSGVLSGTPTAATVDGSGAIAPANLTVAAYDGTGAMVGLTSLPLTIYPASASATLPLNIYWPQHQQLPVAPLGYAYAFQFIANTASGKWSVVLGTLPESMQLDAGTGILSGIAHDAGTSTFTLMVKDTHTNAVATRPFTLRVEQHLLEHVNRISSKPLKKQAGQIVVSTQKLRTAAPGPDFDKSVALLLNMPVLMRAVGLVLRGTFTVPPSVTLPASDPLTLKLAFTQPASWPPFVPVSTQCTVPQPSAQLPVAGFLPYSPTGALTADGWIQPSSAYTQGCLELDAEAQKLVQFGTRAGQRAAGRASGSFHAADPAKVTVFDEDAIHSVLPPTPRTGGLQVWLHNRQDAAATAVGNAQNQGADPAANPRSADTLVSGTAVDILHQRVWYPLTQRDEEYFFPGGRIHISSTAEVHGVRMAATRRSDADPGTTDADAYDIDETVFNWRLGSLVALPPKSLYPYKPVATKSHKPGPQLQNVPWGDPRKKFTKTFTAPADTPSPLFGETYQVAMRPVYITGGTPTFNQNSATQAALGPFTFQRYELMQGPELIPSYCDAKFADDETKTLMMVGSHLDENLNASEVVGKSYRVIVPARISPEVARRHGNPEAAIQKGATVIPLINGALPEEIDNNMMQSGEIVAYLPDPLCVGVIATLTDLNGNALLDSRGNFLRGAAPVKLPYFGPVKWPEYIPHFIELQRAGAGAQWATLSDQEADYNQANFPFKLDWSKKLVCSVPVGQTVLLYLHPQLDERVLTQHILSAKTSLGQNPTPDQLSMSDICRPTIVRLSHAVDRPSGRPKVISADWIPVPNSNPAVFKFTRTPSNTMNLTVTAEPLSTSKVEISADWTDYVDDTTQRRPAPRKSPAQLAEFQIDKHTTVSPAVQPVRLPFSDARYRRLTMNAKAYSRFASCFERDKRHPKTPQPSTGSSPSVLVDVLATAEPPAPDIYMVRPALHWEISETKGVITRKRTAGLTLVINRPWGTSGNFQKLAVIVNLDSQGSPILKTADPSPSADESTHSAWGFMPDFELAGVAYFTQQSGGSFHCNCGPLPKSPAIAAIGLVLDDVPFNQDDPYQEKLATIQYQGSSYPVCLYTPKYNELDQQWYVNLRFNAPPAYGTVVRLVVASYQHFAVKGCENSPFVLCDFALLSAQRYITIKKPGLFHRKVTLTVHGYGAYDASGKNLFSQIEVRYISSEHDNFDWNEGAVIPPSNPAQYTGDVLWQGTVDSQLIVGSTILVREKEVYTSAEDAGKTGDRYVYTDSFEV